MYATQKISRYTEIELRLPNKVLDPKNNIDVSVIPAFAQVSLRVPVQQARQIDPYNLYWVVGCLLIPSLSFLESNL